MTRRHAAAEYPIVYCQTPSCLGCARSGRVASTHRRHTWRNFGRAGADRVASITDPGPGSDGISIVAAPAPLSIGGRAPNFPGRGGSFRSGNGCRAATSVQSSTRRSFQRNDLNVIPRTYYPAAIMYPIDKTLLGSLRRKQAADPRRDRPGVSRRTPAARDRQRDGQHAVFFAAELPHLVWQTSDCAHLSRAFVPGWTMLRTSRICRRRSCST
jgi:hypothetical protein